MQQSLFGETGNILPFNGEVLFFPRAFSQTESNNYFKHLVEEITWKHEAIKIFGKEVMQPRLTAWYGDNNKSYTYSGITMQPHAWTEILLQIKARAETIAGIAFTSALLNYYRNGSDSMGWHRDNEKELGTNPVIGSVSFGAARKFQLRCYTDKRIVRNIELTHGSLLLMRGETQHYWEHQLPKTGNNIGGRVNITFRVIM
jgi:alkylated DNA repair dioxygenase AlkB